MAMHYPMTQFRNLCPRTVRENYDNTFPPHVTLKWKKAKKVKSVACVTWGGRMIDAMAEVIFVPVVLFFVLALSPATITCWWDIQPSQPHPCDPIEVSSSIRPDQVSVLISGYSTSRIPLLQAIVRSYASSSLVSSVIVLWGNQSTEIQVLSQLLRNLTELVPSAVTISLIRQHNDSLNERFLPRPTLVKTEAVLVCDDDVEVDKASLEFAFKVWRRNPDRLVGFFARSHDLDVKRRRWVYTVHPERYSIVLTKFMILNAKYLREYSCGGALQRQRMRRIVDRNKNCEDILMNFVVADIVKAAPILVGATKVRDWGDPRNEDGGQRVRKDGLSSRRKNHRKVRGECIMEFHKVLGKMPLRFNHGKIVNAVGEQGLCNKGGHLVFCDRF